ncbi:MAG TPA: hypothetical protein VJN18_32480 [Polyangiaceae bacterium]|nr:hypothetical protein [Polyangiaceae bacterium]
MAGGFDVSLAGLPEKPSGRTGVDGPVVAPEMSDAAGEAKRLVFEMLHSLTTIAEELEGDRHYVVDERLKALLRRVADARVYVQHLARITRVPHCCPRCKSEMTHDPQGDAMCEICISATYGKVRL